MTTDEFQQAVTALEAFPTESEPDRNGRRKIVGVIGGEPLLHPEFDKLVDIMISTIAEPRHRGLWTGCPLVKGGRDEARVHRLLGPSLSVTTRPVDRGQGGYFNHNTHPHGGCVHHPILVAIQDVIEDDVKMWAFIEQCPLQRDWASAITPKGFFFCEVAAAFDMAFDGPGGVPVSPDCWRHDIVFYRDQIKRWCPRCGMCLPLTSRHDFQMVDDISASNLVTLANLGSPRVLDGDVVQFDPATWEPPADWQPLRYLE